MSKSSAPGERAALAATVPRRWVKLVVALFLLPPAWVLTQTFFGVFARAAIEHAFWATVPFWFFGLGVVVWLGAFVLLPRPLVVYVFGHELTHAISVWLSGGTVTEFEFGARGGHVTTDRVNTVIALAPYFFPVYSVIVIVLYGAAGMVWDLRPLEPMLFMLLGATWAFHFSFTLWMIPKGQPDLAYGGTFFSLVIIYIMNLSVLSAFLVAATPHISLSSFGRDLVANAVASFDAVSPGGRAPRP